MKKVNVYTLGQYGINRVKSPVHTLDGELLNAQNSTVRPIAAQLAITKRDGMAKINASVAAGSILAIVNIPLDDTGWNPSGSSWSSDGVTAPQFTYRDVAWSPALGMFLAVAETHAGGNYATSTDGYTWTARSTPSGGSWNTVVWADELGKWIITGNSVTDQNWLAWSTDGINWTEPTLPSTSQGYGSDWSPDLERLVIFPLDADQTDWFYTDDLVNYTTFDPPGFNTRRLGAAWSSSLGKWTSVYTDVYADSDDGETWTNGAAATGAWKDVCWSEDLGLFIAVGHSSVMTSLDGTTWTGQTPAEVNLWNGVATYNGVVVAMASSGTNRVMTSTDGVNWTARAAANGTNNLWNKVCAAPELQLFVAVATAGPATRIMVAT